MKKYLILGSLIMVLLFSAGIALAGKSDKPAKADAKVALPAQAIEVAPGVFSLGMGSDNGKMVQGYAFVHYKDKKVKPGTECGNGICEPGENARKCPADCGGEDPIDPDDSDCYGFLAKGAMWKTVEDYMVDPTNTRGLDGAFVRSNLAVDIDKWEDDFSYRRQVHSKERADLP